ncbi:MAG: hypothetical protein JW981_07945 [Anaerolineae bacterium]|nr:hypothetical protein [Anaerolineae bacterium]
MHWILTVPDNFSLKQMLKQPQPLLLPPFAINQQNGGLTRIERLASKHIVDLNISQTAKGLLLETEERLNSKEREEITRKTWRLLRLGENLTPFLELSEQHPMVKRLAQQGIRCIRGTSIFEDIIKSLIVTHSTQEWGRYRAAWLVERLGEPLPSNPTRHAFPMPDEILWGRRFVKEMLGEEVGQAIINTTEAFKETGDELESIPVKQLNIEELESYLNDHLNLNQETLGLVMLCLGKYDYIPVDETAQERISHAWYNNKPVNPGQIRTIFNTWQPWGGLVYWLWAWSKPWTNSIDKKPYHSPEELIVQNLQPSTESKGALQDGSVKN